MQRWGWGMLGSELGLGSRAQDKQSCISGQPPWIPVWALGVVEHLMEVLWRDG